MIRSVPRPSRLLDLADLECFLALAELEHFGRAAERLTMSVSAVSKHCARLEQVLGLRLFDRSSRHVQLTTAGAVLIEAARRILTEADEFVELARDAAEGSVGELVVAYSPGNGEVAARVVRVFRARYPNVHCRLEQTLSRDVGAAVKTGVASIGICRSFATRGLRKLVVSRVPLDYLAMPADHRLSALSDVTIDDLAGETLLASDLRAANPDGPDAGRLAAHGIVVRYEAWVSESQVMDSVAAGFGLTVTDKGFLERNPRPDVVARHLASPLEPEPLADYLMWRPDDTSELVRHFVEIARALFSPAEKGTSVAGLPSRS